MIYTEDQIVKVNGVVLPGLVKSIEVKESAQIDEQEVEGSATKPKQATGYEDAKVNGGFIRGDGSRNNTEGCGKDRSYLHCSFFFRFTQVVKDTDGIQ